MSARDLIGSVTGTAPAGGDSSFHGALSGSGRWCRGCTSSAPAGLEVLAAADIIPVRQVALHQNELTALTGYASTHTRTSR